MPSKGNVLTPAQTHQVLLEWNTTPSSSAAPPFLDLFESQASRHPDLRAVVDPATEESLSYRELNLRANALAHELIRRGLHPDGAVGLFLSRSIDFIVAVLGVLKAGCCFVPLDPEYPTQRLAWMCSDAGLRALVTHSRHDNNSIFGEESVRSLEVVHLDGKDLVVSRLSRRRPQVRITQHHAAYIIYTSGSTGSPKGIVVAHGALAWYTSVAEEIYGISRSDRVLQFSSLSFDILIEELFPCLSSGATLVLRNDTMANSVSEFLRNCREWSISTMTLPTAFWNILAKEVARRNNVLPKTMRMVILGGEKANPERLDEWRRIVGDRVRLVNSYGPTETTVIATAHELTPRQSAGPVTLTSIGTPLRGARVYILRADGSLASPGESGELCIGGSGLARGYLRMPGKTAEYFTPDAFSGEVGARLYHTGDQARYLPNGQIDFQGRMDDQIKIHSFRVEPREVEDTLSQFPGLVEVAVVPRAVSGEGDLRLFSFCVPERMSTAPPAGDLRHFLQNRLPDYMVPAHYIFLDRLPRTPNGKIDRNALAQAKGVGEEPQKELSLTVPSARNPVEEQLIEIWKETLGLEDISIYDNIFELGTDSIVNIQIAALASQRGLRFSPKDLFENQTIAELATIIDPEKLDESGQIDTTNALVTGEVPLTPIQRWFFEDAKSPEPWHYSQSAMLEVRRSLDPTILAQTIAVLLRHHDTLRMRFSEKGGRWSQHYGDIDGKVPFMYVDMKRCPRGSLPIIIRDVANQIQTSMDLVDGPLLRVTYFERSPLPARLLIIVHHTVVDGVSWGILLADVENTYLALETGQKPVLPSKTTSYKRWAQALVEHANSPASLQELDYWINLPREGNEYPIDYEDRDLLHDNTVASSASTTVALDPQQTRWLLREVPAVYRTQINDVLLTALAMTITDWTGEDHAFIELEGHGREEIIPDLNLARTIGWFTSAFPVFLDLQGADGIAPSLMRIKEQLRQIPRRGIGYFLLRYLSKDPATVQRLAKLPYPQFSFNYLGQSDTIFMNSSLFSHADEATGYPYSRRAQRSYLIEVAGYVTEERLWISWRYSRNLHRRSTIEKLTESFMDHLREIIHHCMQPEAGGYTASDFPLAGLDTRQLQVLFGSSRDIEDVYPLSQTQQGILFHALYAPSSSVYFEQTSWRISGPLRRDDFRQAWNMLIERHPILRTSFVWQDLNRPLQVVWRHSQMPWQEMNWEACDATEQQALLENLLATDRQRGFELSAAPLMRCFVVKMGEESHRFIWSVHHLLLDGWSISLLFEELFAIYDALERRQSWKLPRARPFRDYIAWLADWDDSDARLFWQESLRDFEAPTPLPLTRPGILRDAAFDALVYRQNFLPESLSQSLYQFARQNRLTLNTLFQAAWALVLARTSGQEDVVFGSTFSGRPETLAGSAAIVGLLVHTLPVNLKVDPGQELGEWLREIQAANLEIAQHQYCPPLGSDAWQSKTAQGTLFDSLVVFQNYPGESSLRRRHGSVVFDGLIYFTQTNYPLLIEVVPDRSIRLMARYSPVHFTATAIERLLGWMTRLLTQMIQGEDQPLGDLVAESPAEVQQRLWEWNDPGIRFPAAPALHELFRAQVERTPDAVAISGPHLAGGIGAPLSYRELEGRANALAHRLVSDGVKPGDLVGIFLERSVEMVVCVLAVLKSGGAYLPIDPAYPASRLGFMLADAQTVLLLTQRTLRERLPDEHGKIVEVDALNLPETTRDTPPDVDVPGTYPAYVIYTSGSTGRPKGTPITHRNASRLFQSTERLFDFSSKDVWTLFHSVAFDFSVWEIWGALLYGGRLVVVPLRIAQSAEDFRQLIQDEKVTSLSQTPSAFLELLRCEAEKPHQPRLRSLRRVVFGGEALDVQRLAPWFDRYGDQRPQMVNMYGITETTVHVTYRLLKRQDAAPGTLSPVGRALHDLQAYVLDARQSPVPHGVPGELYVGGDGLAWGYLQRPSLTAERFVPHPFTRESGRRLYRTGDRVLLLADGELAFLGRVDHQVKIRGFRVELGEVEAAMLRQEDVRAAAAALHEGSAGGPQLVGYLVVSEDAAKTAPVIPNLRESLQRQLPAYMCPAAFVVLDALPTLPNGKLDRRQLPAPAADGHATPDGRVAPRHPTEEKLAKIWQEVLGLADIGVEESFFEIGGHSLLATQVVSRIRQRLHIDMELRVVFERPTIAALAEYVDEHRSTSEIKREAAVDVVPAGEIPLSFAQQRLWIFDRMAPGNIAYNMPEAWLVLGDLHVDALNDALREVIRRHEVLRTTFEPADGIPRQHVHDEAEWRLPLIDLRILPREDREQEALRIINEEATRPFDLERGPLVRLSVLKVDDRRHYFVRILHHIVSDGWSEAVLWREIRALYKAFCDGRPSPLEPLERQYADFAVWQREWLRGEVLEHQLAYWRRQLANVPQVELPLDRPRPAVQSYRGRMHKVELPAELHDALHKLSITAKSSLYMTMLAAFFTLLERYTGQDDLVVGSPIANRNREEIEDLVGFFVNTLILRGRLHGNPTFRQLLGQVRETSLEAFGHQDLPFERLVEELRPERQLNRAPLFQVVFAIQNAPETIIQLHDVEMRLVDLDDEPVSGDMELHLWPVGGALTGYIVYNPDLFDATRIARLAEHYESLLRQIVEDPDRPIRDYPLLSRAERHQLLAEWNDTDATDGSPGEQETLLFPQRFEAWVRKTPTAPALCFTSADGETTRLCYAELDARANRLGRYLLSLPEVSSAREPLVGLALDRTPEAIVAWLAALKIGAAYLPLDVHYPQDRLAFMIEDSAPVVLLTRSDLLASLPQHDGRVFCLDREAATIDGLPSTGLSPTEAPAIHPARLAYVIYTSGSTGRPKGTLLTHRGLANLAAKVAGGVQPGEAVLQFASLSFDGSVYEILMALASGAVLDLGKAGAHPLGEALADLLENRRIHHATLPTAALKTVPPEASERLSDLLSLLVAGEACPDHLPAIWGRNRLFINGYGPTEATVCASLAPNLAGPVTIGRPIRGVRMRVLLPGGRPAPLGVTGEIHLGGASLARGYRNRPALTAERFIPDPFVDARPGGERLYRTGDLARYRADGELEYVGRRDHQVKVRGFRIELGEVEAVLERQAQVREAAVLRAGESTEDPFLVAYAVPRDADAAGAGSADERIGTWQALYDDVYRSPKERQAEFDIIGWESSFTGQPIPADEMKEWVEQTVERIDAIRPENARVLEIGCGTGLLLWRLAPKCRSYLATDFSLAVIDRLRQRLAEDGSFKHVDLDCRAANDGHAIPSASFDLVVLNSVIQYFPSAEYLLEVLDVAMGALAPGGTLFLGDLRNLEIHQLFCAGVELSRGGPGADAETLRKRIETRRKTERELLLSPALFRALSQRYPQLSAVSLAPKHGKGMNEMSLYRFDAVLRTCGTGGDGQERPAAALPAPDDWVAWHDRLTIDAVERQLKEHPDRSYGLRRVPDERLGYDLEILRRVEDGSWHAAATDALPPRDTGMHPGLLEELAARLGRRLEWSLEDFGRGGTYHAVFWPRDGERKTTAGEAPDAPVTWYELTNDPLAAQKSHQLASDLRDALAEQLPEYMVPRRILLLREMPRTPAGKIDRRRLPKPDQAPAATAAAPRTPVEERLAEIWSQVLNVDMVGIHDDFFELGGHSLNATQVQSRISEAFGVKLSLRDLFEHTSIADLADEIGAAEAVPAEVLAAAAAEEFEELAF